MRSRILFISGRPEDALRLAQIVQTLPFWMDHVETIRQARTEMQERRYNVILTAATVSDGNWLDVLHLTRESPDQIEVIVTDPHADAQFWAQVLNLGAYDLLAQPFYEPEVRRILSNACSHLDYGHSPVAAA